MRVCQPGPVARQRATTSGGKRKLMSWRGFSDFGRPPLLTTARASMASVSSGSSLYSCGLILCASTRGRSDPDVRRETGLFTIVCLSHAEDMALCATRGISHHNHSALQLAEADDAALTVFLADILELDRHPLEDKGSVLEVQATLIKGLLAFDRIEGDSYLNSVYTLSTRHKRLHQGSPATPDAKWDNRIGSARSVLPDGAVGP
jgi:hypothetical protein